MGFQFWQVKYSLFIVPLLMENIYSSTVTHHSGTFKFTHTFGTMGRSTDSQPSARVRGKLIQFSRKNPEIELVPTKMYYKSPQIDINKWDWAARRVSVLCEWGMRLWRRAAWCLRSDVTPRHQRPVPPHGVSYLEHRPYQSDSQWPPWPP